MSDEINTNKPSTSSIGDKIYLRPNTEGYFLVEYPEFNFHDNDPRVRDYNIDNEKLIGVIEAATQQLALRYCFGLTHDDPDNRAQWAEQVAQHNVALMHKNLLKEITEDFIDSL